MRMLELAIEPRFDTFEVVEWREYNDDSVLHGQPYRQIHDIFDTLAEAQAAYPLASVGKYPTSPVAVVPDLPPHDFDPADIGEEW